MRIVSSFRDRDDLVAHEFMILKFLPSSAQMEEYVDQNETVLVKARGCKLRN